MSATDRQVLSTREFAAALRAAADLLETDAYDGVQVLDERTFPQQGEDIGFLVTSEETVRAFAARHRGAQIVEHRNADGNLRRVTAQLGFGRGTDHDTPYADPTYKYAVTLEVTYMFPKAAS
jgi:hypothetical protein